MKSLVAVADVTLPNITEASLLTGNEYKENYDEEYAEKLRKGPARVRRQDSHHDRCQL